MHERLNLEIARSIGFQSRNVFQTHLARTYHALGAQLVPYARSLGIHDRRLGADMKIDMRRVLASDREGTHVTDDERVNPRRIKRLAIRGQRGDVITTHKDVQRDMNLHPMCMGEGNHVCDFIQAEVICAGAHAEAIDSQVYGIGAETDSGLKLRKAAGRSQQLGKLQHRRLADLQSGRRHLAIQKRLFTHAPMHAPNGSPADCPLE